MVIAAIAFCSVSVANAPTAGADAVRAMSYNIRLDTEADGPNAWPHRREQVSNLIRFYSPDIVGMQEVLLHQRNQLAESLPEYAFVGFGRDNGAEAGEFSPLAFRQDRFDLVEAGGFWLSQTPERPSLGWDASYRRLVTWARLRIRETNASVLALSTHWDNAGAEARANSARLILTWLGRRRRECESVVLLGDLNARPDERSYQTLASEGSLIDTRTASQIQPFGPAGTFNGFDVSRDDGAPIDYIFVSADVRVLRYGVITQHQGGRPPSDHYPVLTDIVTPEITCEQ
jgi:endonuclease/exonuclease/phosphatase family metal-dependent hydrolase